MDSSSSPELIEWVYVLDPDIGFPTKTLARVISRRAFRQRRYGFPAQTAMICIEVPYRGEFLRQILFEDMVEKCEGEPSDEEMAAWIETLILT